LHLLCLPSRTKYAQPHNGTILGTTETLTDFAEPVENATFVYDVL
jgi:hypothetical protein